MAMRRSNWPSRGLATLCLGVVTLVAAMASCELVTTADGRLAFVPLTGPRKLRDSSGFTVIARRRTGAPSIDVNTVLDEIDDHRSTRRGDFGQPSGARERLLRKVSRTRLITDTKTFKRQTPKLMASAAGASAGSFAATGASASGKCSWQLSKSELAEFPSKVVVPNLDRVPIRNQGQRGTCAAFAGVGALEFLALNPTAQGSNPLLETIDLSEQRFYWLSKPECQETGCPGGEEGSWYGNGFEALEKSASLATEEDCSYKSTLGATDTYVPQQSTCANGEVGVATLGTWCGVRDLIELLDQGYAVPYASPLSDNWEHNDGMITQAGLADGGSSIHADGHAYLLVGYMVLPDMPEEGGLCFIVRNSWGAGWGINGYACMTLAWMQMAMTSHMKQGGQPVPTGILLGDELGYGADLAEEQSENWEVDPDAVSEDDADEVVSEDEYTHDLEPLPPEDDLDPDTAEERQERGTRRVDPRRWTNLEWQQVDLLGPNEGLFRAETASAIGEQLFRGLKPGGTATQPLRVLRDGDKLRYQGDEVGRVEGTKVTLCTGEYAQLCSIRYRTADDQLYLQFRDDDLRSVPAAEVAPSRGQWYGVGVLSIEAFIPSDFSLLPFLLDPKLYVRTPAGEPARLSLRPKNLANPTHFDIRLAGMTVGSVDLTKPAAASLCTGEFSRQCQLVAAQKLLIVPSNMRKL